MQATGNKQHRLFLPAVLDFLIKPKVENLITLAASSHLNSILYVGAVHASIFKNNSRFQKED